MKSTGFHNTISLDGEQLQRANARALSQQDLVKEIFLANPDKMFSPSQIHEIFSKKYDLNPPITSIRRSLTNLTNGKKNDGILVKTNEMIAGQFGLPEHKWALRKSVDETAIWFNEYLEGKYDPPEPKTLIQTALF
jgi:hypothetical protein